MPFKNRLITEDQILDPEFRAKVIKEITATENVTRKKEHLKRYEVYKDQTPELCRYPNEMIFNDIIFPRA